MKLANSYSFLTIGKTQESTESTGFKRYVGIGSSFVLAVNPAKKELDTLMGYESNNDPEYVVNTENGKEARINFIVKTDPKTNNGIEIVNRAMFTLRNAPAYNRDNTKVQVIDKYGNFTWADKQDAEEGKKLLDRNGNPVRIDDKYRMACVGEAALVDFLKHYLGIGSAFDYINGVWVKKDNASDYMFELEHIKDYFNGNFSEIREAIKLQPNNKVKLLYGVRTTDEGRQYQAVITRENLILSNNAGQRAIDRLKEEISRLKDNGSYPTTELKVQELTEYTVQPTDFSSSSASAINNSNSNSDAMPWD